MAKVRRNPRFEKAVTDVLFARFNAAAQIVRNRVIKLINVTQPTRRTKSGRLIGLDPSAPGDPPKRLTGSLVRSIIARVRKTETGIIAEIGTNHVAARRLEFGFRGVDSRGRVINQAPRPFLRRALAESRETVMRILTRGGGE